MIVGAFVVATLLAEVPQPALTLWEAEQRAAAHQPSLSIGRGAAQAAEARALESRASLLPQLSLTSNYRYATGNRPIRIGTPAAAVALPRPAPSATLYDYLNFGVAASQLLYDFGQSTETWRAARLAAESAVLDARALEQEVLLDVRVAFFAARARRELLDVAREDLANQQDHLRQVKGLIDVNLRPPIDLVQARAGVGAAELRRIAAETDYALARAELGRAMGASSDESREVAADELAAVEGEDGGTGLLLAGAERARPDLASADRQIATEERALAAVRGSYGPSLELVLSFTDAGPMWVPGPVASRNLRWNYQGALVLTWPLFEGGRTRARVRETEALVDQARARRQLLDLELRLELERAHLNVASAKAAVAVSETTVESARERLRLAEGRYKAGVGTALEVSDAQLSYVSAAAQRVQAHYTLSAARAQLLHALGRGP